MKRLIPILILVLLPILIQAQETKNEQYSGLGKAASAIFNTDKRYSISGFGEANYVNYDKGNNPLLGDLELYYTSLFRFSTFFGYKITDKLIFNSEILVEHLRDGDESTTPLIFEAYLDARINKNIGIRVGYIPLVIAYINSNDEPVLFHSVNRPEVERLIIPTSWIELGVMAYGEVFPGLNYFAGVFSTPDSEEFIAPTYIRGGAEPRLEVPKSIGVNYQLLFTKYEGLELGFSGFFGDTGQDHKYSNISGGEESVSSFLNLMAFHTRFDYKNMRFIALATYSTLSGTEDIYELTASKGEGQVIGSSVYGYYFEYGIDLLHYFKYNRLESSSFINKSEFKLPIFVRYERLNTHNSISNNLAGKSFIQNDLEIIAIGLNFNLNEDFVIKSNYQIRKNKAEIQGLEESNVFEACIGFNF